MLRVIGYEGEGRHRRPLYVNEGPGSALLGHRIGGELVRGGPSPVDAQRQRVRECQARKRAAGKVP